MLYLIFLKAMQLLKLIIYLKIYNLLIIYYTIHLYKFTTIENKDKNNYLNP